MDNVTRARAIYDAVNSHDLIAFRALFAEQIDDRDHARGVTMPTAEILVDRLRSQFEALPDLRMDDVRLIAAGNAVVAQFTTTGTLAATGRTMRVPTCEVIRFGEDGLVAGTDIYYDRQTMTEQLGTG